MYNIGISEGFHDAGVTVLNGQEIVHASHSERYSRIKNDKWISKKQIPISYRCSAFYESPFLKNTRRLYAGQKWISPKSKYDYYFKHHQTHAAAGYYTAPFNDCNIIVVDAIGEWDTISIWHNMKKIKSWKYPYSLGLLYSAITKRIGLEPNEDEYITMGMAAYGEPIHDLENLLYQNNHRGVGNIYPNAHIYDLAASVQQLYEKKFLELLKYTTKKNLIMFGLCRHLAMQVHH